MQLAARISGQVPGRFEFSSKELFEGLQRLSDSMQCGK